MPNFRMKHFISSILLFFGLSSFGQNVSVDTLHLPKGERFAQLQSADFKFPIIRTVNKKIESLINKDLINKFTHNEYPEQTPDSTLIKWADDQIISLDFEVTYLKNGLISLNISAEGCGAYCTSWTDYFTYSTFTGKYVTINEIVDTTGKFKYIVIADKNRQYEEQRIELKKLFLDKDSGLDEDSYKIALENYDNCDNSFELNSFALYSDHLEIIENCNLPHVMQNLTPIIELKYKYINIKKYLKIKN